MPSSYYLPEYPYTLPYGIPYQGGWSCPNCGYCPCCGRPGQSAAPFWRHPQWREPYFNGARFSTVTGTQTRIEENGKLSD